MASQEGGFGAVHLEKWPKCYVGKLALWKWCKRFAKTLYIKDTVDLCGHSSQKNLNVLFEA